MNIEQIKPGGDKSPGSSKKLPKIKLNRKTIIIGGTIVIIVFFVFRKIMGGNQSNNETVKVLEQQGPEYGTNGVDVAAQLQSNNDVMQQSIMGQVNSVLGSFGADMTNMLQNNNSNLLGIVSDSLQSQKDMYSTSLQQQTEKFTTLNEANKEGFTALKEQVQTLAKDVSTNSSGILELKNPTSSNLVAGTTPTTNTPVQSSSLLAKLVTGGFKDKDRANRIAQEFVNSYGASNIKVTANNNGTYSVTGQFENVERANAVGTRLVERSAISGFSTAQIK